MNKTTSNIFQKLLIFFNRRFHSKLFLTTAFSGLLMAAPYYADNLFLFPLFSFAPFSFFLLDRRFSKPSLIILASFFYVFFYYSPLLNWLSTFHWGVYPSLVFFYYTSIHAATAFLIKILLKRFFALRLLIVPSALLLMEHFKIFGFLGFSLGIAGYSLHNFTSFIQSANVFGIFGVTFMLYFLNALLADFVLSLHPNEQGRKQKPRLVNLFIYAVALILILSYGFFTIKNYEETGEKHIRIALVQQWHDYNQANDRKHNAILLEKFSRLTREAAKENPDIIAFAENAWPSFYKNTLNYGRTLKFKQTLSQINEDRPENEKIFFFLGSSYSVDPDEVDWQNIFAMQNISSNDRLPYQDYSDHKNSFQKRYSFNAYHLLNDKGVPIQETFKKILVPFGESIPEGFLKNYLEKNGLFYSYDHGASMDIFTVKNIRIGVLICFETNFSSFVNAYNRLNPDFFLMPANNAWSYYFSAGILQNHASIFRAIETHRPILSVTNAGVTDEINPLGVVKKKLPQFEEGVLTVDLRLPTKPQNTLYQYIGDQFLVIFYLFLSVLFSVIGFERFKKTFTKNI